MYASVSMAEVDEITVLPIPVTWRVGRLSSEMVLAPRLQMRGLETISTTRRNGRGPDSSLKRLSIFVWTRVYTLEPSGRSPIVQLVISFQTASAIKTRGLTNLGAVI